MNQLNFLRTSDGKIINAAHVLVFEIKKGSGPMLVNGEMPTVYAVTAIFDRATEYLSVHDTKAEADHELDCLYSRLTGWEEAVAVTEIAVTQPPRPVKPAPDPLDTTIREKLAQKLSEVTHELVSSEIKLVEEEKKGLIRRDGGRLFCESGFAFDVVDSFFSVTKKEVDNA